MAPPVDHLSDGLELSLAGDHQFVNAGLAVSLCKCWLQRTGNWEKLLEKVACIPYGSYLEFCMSYSEQICKVEVQLCISLV